MLRSDDCPESIGIAARLRRNTHTLVSDVKDGVDDLLTALTESIRLHTNSRDHKLVEQSDALVVFRPMFMGCSAFGVEEEVNHDKRLRKVYSSRRPAMVYHPTSDENMRPAQIVRKALSIEYSMDESGISEDYCNQIVNAKTVPEIAKICRAVAPRQKKGVPRSPLASDPSQDDKKLAKYLFNQLQIPWYGETFVAEGHLNVVTEEIGAVEFAKSVKDAYNER